VSGGIHTITVGVDAGHIARRGACACCPHQQMEITLCHTGLDQIFGLD
jgi:hypothetical protein